MYKNFVTAVPRIVREEGVKNLFRGFGTTLLRDVPYTALTFVIFENLRAELGRRKTDGPVSLSESMLLGIATAIVCLLPVTIPIDVVKSNVMTSMAGQVSVPRIARDIFAASGVRGFFKGYHPFVAINSGKWSSSMAVYATAYDYYGGVAKNTPKTVTPPK